MTDTDIVDGVIEVIALNSRYSVQAIQPHDPLDKFISSAMKSRLAREIKRRFPCTRSTELTNELYVTIKSVQQLIDAVQSDCAS